LLSVISQHIKSDAFAPRQGCGTDVICTSSGKTVPYPLIYHLELVRLRVVCLQSNNSVHFLAAARNGKTTSDRHVSGNNSDGNAQRQAARSFMHYCDWHSPRRTPPLTANTAQ
jgi:hypothetical protein